MPTPQHDSQPPTGPLVGDELSKARRVLTHQQLRAYCYIREGRRPGWIAKQLGVKRPRVYHLVGAAEQNMGYRLTYTPKQPGSRGRSTAEQRLERREAWNRTIAETEATPQGRATLELLDDLLAQGIDIFNTPLDQLPAGAQDQLRRRLSSLEGGRHRRQRQIERERYLDDDGSRAAGEEQAESVAEMEATFGTNPVTGVAFRPGNFSEDDGRGHNVD